jgi:hypothetical protein
MPKLTIPMPAADLTFLRDYSHAKGTSAEAFLAKQAHNLRQNLQQALPREVREARGVISSKVNGIETHRKHLHQKHR